MIFALFLAVAFAFNNLYLHSLDDAWKGWLTMYKETETMTQHLLEEKMDVRKEIFALNYAYVRMHNSRNASYWLELNEFAAMTNDEFRATRNGYNNIEHKRMGESHVMSEEASPSSVDWRGKLVLPVKNQEQCGSCWAFSTIVSLEGQYAKLSESLLSLSEQDLVDCVKNVKIPGQSDTCCDGCEGGLMDYAFQYMIDSQSGTDDTESSYKYTARNGRCKFEKSKAFKDAKVTKYTDITKGSESELMDATANVGPISVAVNANNAWQLYSGGVLKPLFCPGSKLDHGVAVVGYGKEGEKEYWIIKNSWGNTWGEKGYVRLHRGANTCGVANSACYPTLESTQD
jgi:C1A family cysteine protease